MAGKNPAPNRHLLCQLYNHDFPLTPTPPPNSTVQGESRRAHQFPDLPLTASPATRILGQVGCTQAPTDPVDRRDWVSFQRQPQSGNDTYFLREPQKRACRSLSPREVARRMAQEVFAGTEKGNLTNTLWNQVTNFISLVDKPHSSFSARVPRSLVWSTCLAGKTKLTAVSAPKV